MEMNKVSDKKEEENHGKYVIQNTSNSLQLEINDPKIQHQAMKKPSRKICLFLTICLFVIYIIIGLVIGLIFGLKKEGDLIKITTQSKIGISFDDFPFELRDGILQKLKILPDEIWINRINKKISLTFNRLNFRSRYYLGKKSLNMPTENFFNIKFLNLPTLEYIDGHYLLTRNYSFETYIVGKKDSAKISDLEFAEIGGIIWENFTMPIDPTLLYQNTEYSCMNEDSFPKNSVDPESVEIYYDDSCKASQPPENITLCKDEISGCHCTKGSNQNCQDALKDRIGRVSLNLKFERIKMDYALADHIESKNLYKPNPNANGADIKGITASYQNNIIIYKYISCHSSCEKIECLDNKCGWRKLLLFDNVDVNIGTDNLEVANVEYDGQIENFDEKKYYNMFYYDNCHKHPHYTGYVSYQLENFPGFKLGFCTQDTKRIINHRNYNIPSTYETCSTQGISAGFADNYNIGIPCQWMDITDLNLVGKNAKLNIHSNPFNYMCEGKRKRNKDGTNVIEPTGQYTENPPYKEAGNPIYKFGCETSPGASDNNKESIVVNLTSKGNGSLTSKCKYPYFPIGPKRNCEFVMIKSYETCNPGQITTLKCSNFGKTDIVIRLCESSVEFQTGTACRFNDDSLLSNRIIKANTELTIHFTCPTFRDFELEIGGKYSIYVGHLLNEGVSLLSEFDLNCL